MAEWFYVENDREIGPVPASTIREKVLAGVIRAKDEVWEVGTDDWVPAQTLPGLFNENGTPRRPEPNNGRTSKSGGRLRSSGKPKWYYVENDREVGPINSETLQQKVREGIIGPDDEVWKEGLPDWTPAREIKGLIRSSRTKMAAPAATSEDDWLTDLDNLDDGEMLPPVVAAPKKTKSKDRRSRGGTDAAPLADRLARSERRGGDFAGFWQRFFALFLDSLILTVLVGTLIVSGGAIIPSLANAVSPKVLVGLAIGGYILLALIPAAYYVSGFASERQATLGKRAMGIIVTDTMGHRISVGTALLRVIVQFWLAPIVSLTAVALIVFLGLPQELMVVAGAINFGLFVGIYLIQPFTESRQGLHDMIAGTLVLRE